LQDKLAYGPTFEAALASLFGGGTSSLNQAETPRAAAAEPGAAPQPATDLHGLISEASRDFSDYQKLTAEGKLGEAGKKLDELKRVIDKLNSQKK
jgi:uncharacterized membrane protein (UPF0182 family)